MKDYGRTGSFIKIRNGRLEQNLAAGSGLLAEEVENGVIEVKADPKLYGNVAGILGTIVSTTTVIVKIYKRYIF